MHLDLSVAFAGLIVGFVVGLTGMGGGALMTPVLVLVFHIQPLAAVSSDLVASLIMKPVGAGVHLRRGTVSWRLVLWLAAGSVPSAFAGVLLLRYLGNGRHLQQIVQFALGVALVIAASALALKAVLHVRRRSRGLDVVAPDVNTVTLRPVPTVLVGIAGGLIVGMTSVGSGSLIIVCLLFLYPRLHAGQLVGTDLAQAIPLVGSAALGHILFGDFSFGLTTSLLVGSIPGVYFGARISAHAPSGLLQPVLAFVLLASGLKLAQVGNAQLAITLGAVLVIVALVSAMIRATDGLTLRRAADAVEVGVATVPQLQ